MRIDLSPVVYDGQGVYLTAVNQVKELDVCMEALTQACYAYSQANPDTTSPSEVMLEITHAVNSPTEAFLYISVEREFLGFVVCSTYKIGRGRTRFEVRHTYLVPYAPRNLLHELAKKLIDIAQQSGSDTFSFAVRMKRNRPAAFMRKVNIPGLIPFMVRFEKELNDGQG